jgi:plastocyanin
MSRLLVLLPVALLLAACGGGSGDGSASQMIQISEREYSLNPSSIVVPKAGTYTFDVTNDGKVTHALTIEQSGGGSEEETGDISPGSHKTVEFTFSADGSYEMYCPVDGHKQQGTISVGGSASGGGTATTDEDDGGGETTTDSGPGY